MEFPKGTPSQYVQYSLAQPPPPPPPPPPAPLKSQIVQPVQRPPDTRPVEIDFAPTFVPDIVPELLPAATAGIEEGDPLGVEGGVAGGIVGGVIGGVVTDDAKDEGPLIEGEQMILPLDAKLPLRPLSQTYPLYPETARLNGIEDSLVVRYTIDKKGRVREVIILRHAANRDFDEAAVRAIRTWRFTPMVYQGERLEVVHDLTVNFVLNQG